MILGNRIRVGMADARVSVAPSIITALGLGSCVGVVLYDEQSKIAGMVHIMLPYSNEIAENSNGYKFADTGVKMLTDLLFKEGVSVKNLKAKIAGGAQMFKFNSNSDSMKIGKRNIEAVKLTLEELEIPLVSEDTGKDYGRTIEFDCETCKLLIKAVGKEPKII